MELTIVEDWTIYLSTGITRSGNGKASAFKIISDWYNYVDTNYNRLGERLTSDINF